MRGTSRLGERDGGRHKWATRWIREYGKIKQLLVLPSTIINILSKLQCASVADKKSSTVILRVRRYMRIVGAQVQRGTYLSPDE